MLENKTIKDMIPSCLWNNGPFIMAKIYYIV